MGGNNLVQNIALGGLRHLLGLPPAPLGKGRLLRRKDFEKELVLSHQQGVNAGHLSACRGKMEVSFSPKWWGGTGTSLLYSPALTF